MSTADQDVAHRIAVDLLNAVTFEVLDGHEGFKADVSILRLSQLTIASLSLSSTIRVEFASGADYHVGVPLSGSAIWSGAGGGEGCTDDKRAVMFNPGESFGLTTRTATSLLVFQIAKPMFQQQLGYLLERPIPQPPELNRVLETGDGSGGRWVRFAQLLVQELEHSDSLISHPLLQTPTETLLLTGLLTAAGHQYSEELHRSAAPLQPTPVERALDIIHANPSLPLTAQDLARIARVSPRRLQESFSRHVGATPLEYLRLVRLDRAHEDLRATNPWECTVSDIAHKWGFTHMGRFAISYKARFGQSPSQTLASEPQEL